jgi:homoserine dehydrogenase
VHAALRRILRCGDQVRSVSGSFSGTLGVVATGLQAGRPLSAVVTDARAAGVTEPDPRDDLSGLDVARKALILARLLGWTLELSDVRVESMFPASLAQVSVEAFMAALPQLDAAMAARAAAAAAEGCTLRYVARVAGGQCSVGLDAVPLDSPLGRLTGTDNLVEIW